MFQGKLMILLVASRKDIAGQNIAHHLLSNYPFKQTKNFDNKNPLYSGFIHKKKIFLTIINEEIINSQNLTKQYPDLDFIIFLSRHSSTSAKPTFSVHTPGNLNTADFGGLPKKLSIAPAEAMRNALKALELLRDGSAKDFDVSYKLDPEKKTVYINLAAYFWHYKADKRKSLDYLEKGLKNGYDSFEDLYDKDYLAYFFKGLIDSNEFKELVGWYNGGVK